MGKWFSEDQKVMSRLPVIRRGACCLSGIKYLVSFPCSGDGFRNAASGVHAEVGLPVTVRVPWMYSQHLSAYFSPDEFAH